MNASSWWKKGLVPVLVVAIGGGMAWQWQRLVALTSAASPSANAAPARASHSAGTIRAEGRLVARPGAVVTVGADFGGTVRAVKLEEKAHVNTGDLLADIAADETRAAVAEAQARVHEADVDIAFLDGEAAKAQRLLASNAVPKDLRDRALHDRDAAKARRASAQATAARLGATLAKSRVTAPIDGVVLERHVDPGEVVAPGASVAVIADLSRVRIEAEVDELDGARIAVGEEVAVRAEGFADTWRGTVEEIPDAVGARKLRPQDPGRPSDTRVLAVKIALTEATPLKLGQRVELSISTK
jgi:RND family efflux transporter MFP subunit